MPELKGLQDVNAIQKRLVDKIKENPETIIEGSFKRDIINATSEEFKNAYFELDLIKDAVFAGTSWGEYLTAKCSDFGIDRKLAVKAHGEVTVKGTFKTYTKTDKKTGTKTDIRQIVYESAADLTF